MVNIESFNIAISFIGEIKIPSAEFYPVHKRESPMYPEVVFQVAEERFDGLGILGDIRPVKELEHVRDRTLQIDIGLAYFVMCIGHLFRLGIHGFLSDELPIFFMPPVKSPKPEYPVVVCPDTVYLPYKTP